MSGPSKVGDHVRWNSEASYVSGHIQKIHSRDRAWKGDVRHCSVEDLKYELKSDKTEHLAMHKGSALRQLPA